MTVDPNIMTVTQYKKMTVDPNIMTVDPNIMTVTVDPFGTGRPKCRYGRPE